MTKAATGEFLGGASVGCYTVTAEYASTGPQTLQHGEVTSCICLNDLNTQLRYSDKQWLKHLSQCSGYIIVGGFLTKRGMELI